MVPGVRFALTKFLRPGVDTYFDFSRHAANVLYIHHIELPEATTPPALILARLGRCDKEDILLPTHYYFITLSQNQPGKPHSQIGLRQLLSPRCHLRACLSA